MNKQLCPGKVYWRGMTKYVYLGLCRIVTEDGARDAHVAIPEPWVRGVNDGTLQPGDKVYTAANVEDLLLGAWAQQPDPVLSKNGLCVGDVIYQPLFTKHYNRRTTGWSHMAERLARASLEMRHNSKLVIRVDQAIQAMRHRTVTAEQVQHVLRALLTKPHSIANAAERGHVSEYTARQVALTVLSATGQ